MKTMMNSMTAGDGAMSKAKSALAIHHGACGGDHYSSATDAHGLQVGTDGARGSSAG